MASAVSRLTGSFSRLSIPRRAWKAIVRIFTHEHAPNFSVEWDCSRLEERGDLPERLGPYPIAAQLPSEVLDGFRQNPFAMRPDPALGAKLFDALFADEEASQAVQRLLSARDIERQLVISADVGTFSSICDVPWEFLAPSRDARPFGMDPRLSLIRTLRINKQFRARQTKGSVRIAHILCNDSAVGAFDDEARALHDGFAKFYARLRPMILGCEIGAPDKVPTLAKAAEILAGFSPHVLIFIGHGRATQNGTELRFTQWEPIQRFVTNAIGSCGEVSLVLLIACNTAHTGQGWTGSLPASRLGVPALLGAGPVAVCAMQAALSAKYAVPFVELFLRSMFWQSTLSAAFNVARRQAQFQSMFEGSTGWAVPLLFVDAENIDSDLSLRGSVEGFWSQAERQLASFPSSPPAYVPRVAVDGWLDRTLDTATGIALLEADAGCGATTSLAAAALRRWRRTQDIVAGNSASALPRPTFYIDASTGRSLVELLATFGPAQRRLIAGPAAESLGEREIANARDLALFINAVPASIVIDHAWALDPVLRSELVCAASLLKQGTVLLVARPGTVGAEVTQRTSLALLSCDECVALAVALQRPPELGEKWWKISKGNAQHLKLLAMRDDLPDLDAKALMGEVELRWRQMLPLVRHCACFPQGLCRRWFTSLGLPYDDVIDAAVELGILVETSQDGMPWLHVASHYRQEFFEQQKALETGWRPVAYGTFTLMRRLLPVSDLHGAPTGSGHSTIIQVYRRVAELLLLCGALDDGAMITRAVCLAERPSGRHLANAASLEVLFAVMPMAHWRAGDLLSLAISAQGLGRTRLHGAVLNYLECAKLAMTTLETVTYLNQRASFLKDSAQIGRIEEIRILYGRGLALAEGESRASSPDEISRRDFQTLSCILLHNWGVAERYIGDATRAPDLLARARDGYSQLGDVRGAARAAVERAAAELDLPNHVPDWDALQAELSTHAGLLERDGAIKDLAFARYQLGRLYKKRGAAYVANAVDAYGASAEAARRILDRRMEGAALKHYAILGGSCGILDKVQQLIELRRAASLLEDLLEDSWGTRVRRDVLTAIAELCRDSNISDARDAWRRAVESAIGTPLRVDRPGSDRHRLGALFSVKFESLIDQTSIDYASGKAFPQRVPSESKLAALRKLEHE